MAKTNTYEAINTLRMGNIHHIKHHATWKHVDLSE